VKKSHF